MKADYLIIGQGICGTLLSYELVKRGKSVLVMDVFNPSTASRVARGLINPVTGKRIVASWMINELLPVAIETYKNLEQHLGVHLLEEIDIIEFHRTGEERDIFQKRLNDGCSYLAEGGNIDAGPFNFHAGTGLIKNCVLVNLELLLAKWRNELMQRNALAEQLFDPKRLQIDGNGVHYNDIEAERVILCNGVTGFSNPWFSLLPYTFNKGEILIASIPGLPPSHIYKQGIKIIPQKDGLFWIGASYEWKYNDAEPTASFRQKVAEHLKYWLKLPFEIKDHRAAERPATVDYKPFTGFHPLYPQVGILNGMGSKGCSQAPYFAQEMAMYLTENGQLHPEADIKRFSRLLSR